MIYKGPAVLLRGLSTGTVYQSGMYGLSIGFLEMPCADYLLVLRKRYEHSQSCLAIGLDCKTYSVDAAEAVAWGLRVRGEDRLGEHGGGPRQDPTLDPHGRQPQQAGPGQVGQVFGHVL
jgi:hypothetical protein